MPVAKLTIKEADRLASGAKESKSADTNGTPQGSEATVRGPSEIHPPLEPQCKLCGYTIPYPEENNAQPLPACCRWSLEKSGNNTSDEFLKSQDSESLATAKNEAYRQSIQKLRRCIYNLEMLLQGFDKDNTLEALLDDLEQHLHDLSVLRSEAVEQLRKKGISEK